MSYQRLMFGLTGILCALISMASVAEANESALATSPAFSSRSVEPNVAFLLDDSGSMRLGFMPDGLVFDDGDPDTGDASIRAGLLNLSCVDINLINPDYYFGGYAGESMCYFSIRDNARADRQFLASSDVNTIYYDPDFEYLPPPHPDGGRFPDADYECAWVDGYEANLDGHDSSCSLGDDQKNLSDDYRAIMDDFLFRSLFGALFGRSGFTIGHNISYPVASCLERNSWGICQRRGSGEGGFYYELDESIGGCDSSSQDNDCFIRRNLNEQSETAQQNFANWFSYYRNRLMASRAGIGEAFSALDAVDYRVAWGAINSADMDGIRAGETFQNSRRDFLRWLYTKDARGGTPLRAALAEVAHYFGDDAQNTLDLECRPNHTVLMTDGYWNERESSLVDDSGWNWWGWGSSESPEFAGAANEVAREHGLEHLVGNFGFDTTLADVAAHHWREDIYPEDPDGRPLTQANNPAEWQHMITHGVGLGVQGTFSDADYQAYLARWHAFREGEEDSPPDLIWRNPNEDPRNRKIDDLRRAALISRGQFFTEPTTEQFAQSLKELLESIVTQAGSASGVAVESGETDEESTGLVFNSVFWPNSWHGDLLAFDGNLIAEGEMPEPIWEASDYFSDDNFNSEDRLIFTRRDHGGILFEWNPDDLDGLSTQQQELFNLEGGDAEDVFQFIRGDNDALGDGYRNRISPLGSIVHSTPEVVSDAASLWPSRAPYGETGSRHSDFRNSIERDPVVYVGANDGMLHGFDARRDGGAELLAYVPEFLMEDLSYLASEDYEHRYYVDLTPNATDVFMNGSWRTLLIGGARTGGRGIFALDVTDPSGFTRDNADSIVLWEFSEHDDDRMGYLKEPPVVAMADWSDEADVTDYRWTAFFGNGYRSEQYSTGLFMLDIEAGANSSNGWPSDAVRYVEFDESYPGESGLSAVTLADTSGDDVIDRVYAGDLEGNLWVAESSSEGWRAAPLGADQDGLLFSAEANNRAQPITAAPALARNPDSGTSPNLLVFFGTGSALFNRDASSSDQQSFYGVRDIGIGGLQRSNLDGRQLSVDGGFRQSDENESLEGDLDDLPVSSPDVSTLGWFMDLETGAVAERVVDKALVRAGNVYFGTQIPEADECRPGGAGWIMGISFDGTTPTGENAAFPELGDVAGFQTSSMVMGLNFAGDTLFGGLSDGSIVSEEVPPRDAEDDGGDATGRRAWREIFE